MEPRNGDLNRAIRRSQLLALKLAVTFYAKLSHPHFREPSGYSPEDITTPLLTWINRALVKNEKWTTNPAQQRQTEERIERAFTHPEPHDGPAAQRQQELRDIALDLTLAEIRQHVPTAIDWPRFETLLRQDGDPAKGEYPGWWRLFRAFLAEEIKLNEPVRAILVEQGIARILETQADLTDAVATLQAGLESVVAELAPALAEFRAAVASLDATAGRIETALAVFDTAARHLTEIVTAAIDENARKWLGIRRNDGKETPRAQRIKDRPTELMIARYCIVPFQDRSGLLAELLGWAADTAGPRAQGLLYTAPGGAGKTPLGIELIDALHKRGWRTTFLSQRNGQQLPPGALADNMRADTVPGICVVLDYAEGQIPNLEQVAQAAAAADETGPPIRILAFARSAEGWWEEFASRPGADIVFDRYPRQDMTGALDAKERQALFASARAAFVQQRQAHGLSVRDTASSPDLSAADSPLLVAANAYLDAADVARTSKQSVLQVLFEEEQRHWRRVAGATAADEVEALARAATQATLVLGATEGGVLALMRADSFGAKTDPHTTLRQLRRLYGCHITISRPGQEAPEEAEFIAPIEPDLLGEHAAMMVLGKDTDGLLAATLRTALAGSPLFAGDVAAILTVLTRSTHPAHEHGIEAAAIRAIATITVTVPMLSTEEVARLASALPRESVALLELSAVVAQHVVASPPTDTSDAGLAERASALNNLGIRLSNLGRREEALAASEEAVRHYRELVGKNRDAFLPDLVLTLGGYGSALLAAEQADRAADAFAEAIESVRPLADAHPAAFGDLHGNLARDLVRALRDAGRDEAGIARVLDGLGLRVAAEDDAESPPLTEAKRLFEAWIEALQAWAASPSEATEADATQHLAALLSHLNAQTGDAALAPIRVAVADILRQLGSSNGQEPGNGG